MENHVRLLGILNIAVGSVCGLTALFDIIFFGGAYSISSFLGINNVIVGVWLWAMLLLFIPSIVVGIALLTFRPWSRTMGIILSILELLNVPLGTGLALYGLWVLFSEAADLIFIRRYGQSLMPRR